MILDFTDCNSIEEVNQKWLKYAEEMEPYKSFLKRLEEVQPNRICICGHERSIHDFHNKGECRVDVADVECNCKKFKDKENWKNGE